MKRLLLALWLLGALVFTANVLILTGHVPGERLSKSAISLNGEAIERDTRNTPSEVAVAAVETRDGEIGTRADSPDSLAPRTVRNFVQHPALPLKDEQAADLDEPALHPAADPVIQAEGAELATIGNSTAVIRAAPSASAAQLFSFPFGRRVRVGERENGFAKIEDLGSGEVGWVEETALGPAELNTQRSGRESYADAKIEQPAMSKPRAKGRWARQRGRKGGLLGRLFGRF